MGAENNTGDSKDFNREELVRFDFLMGRHLAQEATDLEIEELRRLSEKGYEKRYHEWMDAYSDPETTNLAPKSRKEILMNILGEERSRTKWWVDNGWWSWAAVLFVALGGVLWFTQRSGEPTQIVVNQQKAIVPVNEMRVLTGKQYVVLPDGSRVLMNANSELSYFPDSFEGGSREVRLSGEAFFDIVRNPEKPFLVKSGEVVTRVLGTSFNVNMHQSKVVVTVTRGLVEVGRENRVYAKIKPDEQITVNTETEQFKTSSVHATEEIAWKNAYLVMDNMDLESAAKLIGDHYGVSLIFSNKAVVQCRMTASFLNNENLNTVLNVLSQVIGASYKIDGNRILIEGGSCE